MASHTHIIYAYLIKPNDHISFQCLYIGCMESMGVCTKVCVGGGVMILI